MDSVSLAYIQESKKTDVDEKIKILYIEDDTNVRETMSLRLQEDCFVNSASS